MRAFTRRAALLGATGLLAGCDSITNAFDRIFGDKKTPLTGERTSVLAAERPLGVDEGDIRAVTLPPPAAVASWPQAGGSASHAGSHPALGIGLRQVWSTSVGTGAAYRRRLVSPPILAEDSIFAADAYGLITALDASNGRQRWSFDTRPEKERDGALGAGLAHDGGVLYAVTGLAEAMSLDPATGKVGWRVALPAPTRGPPTIAGGRIFVATTDNQLLALSASDGQRLWTYRGQPTTTLVLGLPAPAVEGDIVVAGFASGELTAIRASDGRQLWSETLSSSRGGGLADIAAITAMPVIDRNRVFAAGLGGLTIAIDLRSGRRLWEREVTLAETPWVVGDWLFLVTTGGDLACLGRDDGRVRWLTSLGRFENPEKKRDPITWGPPTLAGGRLFVAGSHGIVREVNPLDGAKFGEITLGVGASQAPAVVGGTLYLLTDAANLVAMRGAA